MSDFWDTPSAREWACDAVSRYSNKIFGKVTYGVVWSDARDADGNLLVPLEPSELVAGINREPFILTDGHDIGKPKGQVLESKMFISEGGRRFVIAIFGYYAEGDVLLFDNLNFDTRASAPTPQRLPELPADMIIQLAIDPREVDSQWLEKITVNSEVPIKVLPRSNNAANAVLECITVGLPYLILVWNPFVTAIASEAGKSTYAALDRWLCSLLCALEYRKNPVLEIQAHHYGCQVSFLFRGKSVSKHLVAHESLKKASVSAAQLITNLNKRDMQAQKLIYEFDDEGQCWYPSYAILNDKRVITSSAELIAIDKLPSGLSLGFIEGNLVSPLSELTDNSTIPAVRPPERSVN